VAGIPVTWIVPHEYTQNVPNDVDYRTMLTFLEFYETFVKFALFKLYHSENLKYPPALDAALDAQACRLHALRAEALDAQGDDDGAAEGAAEEAKQAEEGADADEAAVKKQQKASKKRLKSLSKTLAAEQAGGETAAAAAEEEEEEDCVTTRRRLPPRLRVMVAMVAARRFQRFRLRLLSPSSPSPFTTSSTKASARLCSTGGSN